VLAAGAPIFGSLVTADFFVVSEDDPIVEDVYVTSRTAIVDGTIEGDLTIFTGNLTINGEVTGNVQVFSSGTVRINEGGRIGGSLRGAALNITVSGEVASDVFASAASVVVEEEGTVGRDVMAFGGVLRVEGDVGRDIRGRTARSVIDGSVGGDIDVASQKLELGSGAVVSGDVLYRSPVEASVGPGAQVSGTVTRLPAQSNFVYSVILTLANLVGFLGFLLAGLVALVLLRGSGSRATGAVLTKPIRSLIYGLIAVVVAPVSTVILAATLVGIPLAVLVVLIIVASFVVGPVPAIAALGNRVLGRRGGLLGAFVVGAVLWRFGIWAIPVFGGVLYIVALVWGIGAWIVGFIDTRRDVDIPLALLPASMTAPGGVPDDWTPPFAPGFAEEEPTEGLDDDDPPQSDDEQPFGLEGGERRF
jgi:cytoskeletal protein CcmA (bactofilin family)